MVYKDGTGKRQERASEQAECSGVDASNRCTKRSKQRVRFFWGRPYLLSIPQQQQDRCHDRDESDSGGNHSNTREEHVAREPSSLHGRFIQPLLCGNNECAVRNVQAFEPDE